MTNVSQIEAHERSLDRIFSDDFAFEIPAYQRPYAWETDNVTALFSDLADAMAAVGGVYFLGSIVLIKSPESAVAKVVDGQQRLTTLTILLSVLRDLTTDQDRRFERRTYIYQKGSADKGTADRYRLVLREQDRTFFRERIQTLGATSQLPDHKTLNGSQQRIVENASTIRKLLLSWDELRRDQLVAFLVQRCFLVTVAVPTPEAARRIFTVLNARGLDLTPTDLLKADLLEHGGPEHEGSLAARWEAVEVATGRDQFVDLFGHIRMIYEKAKPRESLEIAFPKFVDKFRSAPESFLSQILEPLADAWRLLDNPIEVETRFGAEAARALRSLRRVDNKDWLPSALLIVWRRASTSGADVSGFLIKLERLTYYLFVTRADVNERIGRFSKLLKQLDSSSADLSDIELTASEQAEFRAALDGPIYRSARVCKPVLQRLDEALSAGGASYDKLVSIEHVLPQTVLAGTDWATLFPDETQRQLWTHRIANLVFLTQRINVKASNWDFDRKKKEYFASREGTSPFPITQGVLQTQIWNPALLSQRQTQLVEKLAAVWRLQLPPTPAP